jgi:hypothetical protein
MTNEQIASLIVACILIFSGVFQFLLAAGFPLGEYAYGGYYKEKLPRKLRITSAVFIFIWLGFATVMFHYSGIIALAVSYGTTHTVIYILTALMGVGTVMNALSRSKKERQLWTPVIGTCFLLCLYICFG